jgi:hypothetical protein
VSRLWKNSQLNLPIIHEVEQNIVANILAAGIRALKKAKKCELYNDFLICHRNINRLIYKLDNSE